jgi:hypothetical protein
MKAKGKTKRNYSALTPDPSPTLRERGEPETQAIAMAFWMRGRSCMGLIRP